MRHPDRRLIRVDGVISEPITIIEVDPLTRKIPPTMIPRTISRQVQGEFIYVIDAPPKRSQCGRRSDSGGLTKKERLRLMLEAKRTLQVRGEAVTQRQLMAVIGIRGDPRRVREWLAGLNMTWHEFLEVC